MENMITRPNVPRLIENKLNAIKCNKCGNIRYPARTYCNKCQGTDFSSILIGPKGIIQTFTTSYKKKKRDKQQIFGIVELFTDDGKDSLNLMGTFDTENFDEVKIGKEVELLPNDKNILFKIIGD
ncbi:MAG: Zn-ribbon domain-containing OB-fold protein [Promethearchaeota archaeon]